MSERGSKTDGEFRTPVLKREIHDRFYKETLKKNKQNCKQTFAAHISPKPFSFFVMFWRF